MIILIIVSVIFILFIIENTVVLTVNRYSLHINGFKNLKAVHISDLHKRSFGKNNRRLIKKILKLSPDVIFITGDIVSRDCADFSGVSNLLTALCGKCRVFISLGNHELDLPQDKYTAFCDTVKNCGANLLDNSFLSVSIKGCNLNICGISLFKDNYKKTDTKYKNLSPYTFNDMIECVGENPFENTILLAHNPLFFREYVKWQPALVLSGHIHGGAVRLPFIKGLLSPERKFFPEFSKGFYCKKDTVMLVSGGLAKLRLFNPPEICFISFE